MKKHNILANLLKEVDNDTLKKISARLKGVNIAQPKPKDPGSNYEDHK